MKLYFGAGANIFSVFCLKQMTVQLSRALEPAFHTLAATFYGVMRVPWSIDGQLGENVYLKIYLI